MTSYSDLGMVKLSRTSLGFFSFAALPALGLGLLGAGAAFWAAALGRFAAGLAAAVADGPRLGLGAGFAAVLAAALARVWVVVFRLVAMTSSGKTIYTVYTVEYRAVKGVCSGFLHL